MNFFKHILLFLSTLLFFANSFSQENAWINYNQQYFKICVARDGMYRLSAAELMNAGVPISAINADNLQLFHNGSEQHIFINNITTNGNLALDGYIEFYGQKNRSNDELDFYNYPQSLVNPDISLYNDTAAYFLTWNNHSDNLRFQQYNNTDFQEHIANKQEFCIREKRANYASTYYGANSSSLITESEGWLDASANAITINGITKTVTTPQAYTNGTNAEVEFAVASISMTNQIYFNVVHDLQVSCQNIPCLDTVYNGYNFVRKTSFLPASNLSNNLTVNFVSSHDAGQRYSLVSYINVKYPHTWNFENASSFAFLLPANQHDSHDYLAITNFSASEAVLYDLTNNLRITTTNAENIEMLVPNANAERKMLLVGEEGYLTPRIEKISADNKFTNYLQAFPRADFVIVTHKNYFSACEEYASYRNTTGYKSIVADIAELYNQYAYGVNRNPVAIRRFCKQVYNSSPSQKYLFLVGRALEANVYKKSPANAAFTTVPSAGNPASDQLFTAGLNGTGYQPLFATGRLAVTNADDILTYKYKVAEYESTTPQTWMKDVLFFGGGQNASEQNRIQTYLRNYENIIEDTLLGANVHTFLKTTSAVVATTNGDSVNNLINNGVSIINFFGHGSSTSFDFDIMPPENYQNNARYPLMIGSSCYVGAIHTTTNTLSDIWVKSPKGAIAFISSMDQGDITTMDVYNAELYKNIAYKNYAKPIGVQIANTIKNVLTNNNSTSLEITTYQETLHGDPSIVINAFEKPDLMIDNEAISILPAEISTAIDSFQVSIKIKNLGKTTNQQFYTFVTRRLPNGNDTVYSLASNGIVNSTTLMLKMPTDIINGAGLNNLRIYTDAMANIEEESETNNYVSLDFYIRSNDVFPIFPYEFAIYPHDTVSLVASPNDPFANQRNYRFQIDTTDKFNSPFLQQTTIFNENGGTVRWKLPFSMINNTVYYWRVAAENENAHSWRESSFIYIEGEEGWSQAHYYQFKKDKFTSIDYNPRTQHSEFSQLRRSLVCSNTAQGNFDDTHWSIDGILGQQEGAYSNCNNAPAMTVVVIDPLTLKAWKSDRENYGHRNYPKCFSSTYENPFYTFDLNPVALGNMNNLLNAVPDGHYILIYSWRTVNYSIFPAELKTTLHNLGAIRDFNQMTSSNAYIFCTKKGTPSINREVYGPVITMDTLRLSTNNAYGFIESVEVGPARRWEALNWQHLSDENDTVSLQVFGIKPSGDEVLLIDSISADELEVLNLDQHVDYRLYPNVKLNFVAKDATTKTAAQLKKWQLRYDGVGETAIDPNTAFIFHSDTIQRGDELIFALATQNVSNYNMDSLVVKYWLRDSRNNETIIDIRKLRTHPAGDIIIDTLRYSTLGLIETNSIWVEFNPINQATGTYYQPEQYHFNNIATKNFYVTTDNQNPLLEVSFDGKYIMNGEIVSAKPEILITLKDENKYLPLNDTALFDISLQNLTTGQTKSVHFGNQDNPLETIEWLPADMPDNKCKIIYKPIFTQDGTYRLQVQAKDIEGNISGDNKYIIDFEIVTKSTITNLLNYPNPFSSQTRFVFELTGSEIPDEMQIEIFTVSGKLVKRIYLDELGPITIGKNITEYAWDGCDTYGDRLANGVYFYTVKAKINGEDIDKRDVGTDKYFKKEIGKMYILR